MPQTVGQLKVRLGSFGGELKALGGGMVVLVALGFSDLTGKFVEGERRWPIAVFVSAVLAAGYCLSRAWTGTHFALKQLETMQDGDELGSGNSVIAACKFFSSRWWAWATRVFIAVSGAAYLFSCWQWAM